ncbi:hypothetical protein PIB30_079616 [Stylosanthes scabra]|uniref:Uncharacterized protein n=1 Tax=Stylosanthes scabra TaxID=79078 RepID=A0ABU6XP73_9FABA|nr:hypothetical protein [Stylosanthes scabra]
MKNEPRHRPLSVWMKKEPQGRPLRLKGCKRLQSLPELPPSIIRLEAHNWTLLPIASSSLTNFSPQEHGTSDDSLRRIKRRRAMFADNNFRIFYQDQRIPKWFTYQAKGASITFELDQPYDLCSKQDFDHIYMSFDRGGIMDAVKAYKLKYEGQRKSYNCNLKVNIEFYFCCCTFEWNQDHDWLPLILS